MFSSSRKRALFNLVVDWKRHYIMSHLTHELEPGIAASRILGRKISTIVSVVKTDPAHFYLLLMQKELVTQGAIDPANTTRKEQEATTLYQACMDVMKIDPTKFPVMMGILSQYPLLDVAVKEMKKEGEHFVVTFVLFITKLR